MPWYNPRLRLLPVSPPETHLDSRTKLNSINGTTAAGFGTWGGVFTPCTLTILGVIMFLRFGYVVGNAGVFYALLIVAISKVITLLTSFSLSAIATNTRVEGGGAYFLISRSLGPKFGGAIGIVFFFAQAISVALYVIGFSDVVGVLVPGLPNWLIATLTNLIVFGCVYLGAGWAIRVQYFILAVLGLSLLSFYIGAIQKFDPQLLAANWAPDYLANQSFYTMFALFFPAVTGIMAGANMSGDLREPAKAIPQGTIAAVLVTGLIYLSQAVLMGGASRHEQLIDLDHLVISQIAIWPLLITAGVFAATLSSALASMMGAPRILQAVCKDGIFPRIKFFAVGSGPANEPRRAIILSFAISQVGILLADLDTIAPLITMCFMITYGLLNLATFFEGITKNPSYRPRFHFSHWTLSLIGAFGCFAVMILINWLWALVSLLVMAVIYAFIAQKQVEMRWGDLNSGLLFERTRKSLLKLEKQLYHPKNWRPIILALSGASGARPRLAIYGNWFTSGNGILAIGHVIEGDVDQRIERRTNQERLMRNFIREQSLEAFPAVIVSPTLADGVESLVQCHGLGALQPNTVLIGWPSENSRTDIFSANLRTVANLGRSIIVMRLTDKVESPRAIPSGTIDVWWRGQKNGELMLILAHLLVNNIGWRGRTIRLMRVIESEAGREDVLQHLQSLTLSSRIDATCEVHVGHDAAEIIQKISRDAALVFLGFEVADEGRESDFIQDIRHFSGSLQRIAFVSSAGEVSIDS
ncbi:MAG: amino acid permease [Planctomycetota bacterium]|nr:amino acid permease [Planctomycetota bacterium]